MKCLSCGHHVTKRAKFCDACGAPIVPRVSIRAESAKKSWHMMAALVLLGIVAGAGIVYFLTKPQESAHNHASFDPSLRGEALAQRYPDVYQVASQFICPCGSCTDGLEVCDCDMTNGSFQVRAEIFNLLQTHEPPHAIELIAARYGHRKSETSTPAMDWEKPPTKFSP